MGNAMACCGKSEADPNNINTAGFVGETKGGHLKIAPIVKI